MKTSSNSPKKKTRLPVEIALVILVLAAVAVAILITGPTDDTVNPVPATATPIPTSFHSLPRGHGQSKPDAIASDGRRHHRSSHRHGYPVDRNRVGASTFLETQTTLIRRGS